MSTRIATRAAAAAVVALALLAACGDTKIPVDPIQPVTVASVVVSPAERSIIVGTKMTLSAIPKAADGRELERDVTWASENESLAVVSATGLVTTIAAGQVAILATSEGKTGRATLTITPVPVVPVAEVRLSVDEEIVLEWDGRTQITATALDAQGNVLADRHIQWASNRPSIAAVWNGNIEAQNPGTATITATVEGVPASVGVRVKAAPVTAVSIEAGVQAPEVGETFVYGVRVVRANGEVTYGPVSWTSSNPAVLRVAHAEPAHVALEALSAGATTLTASSEGVSATISLRVTPKPTQDLVYSRPGVNGVSEIFTLDIAGNGSPARVNAGNVSREPSPSPDGTQLVFAVSQLTTLGEWQHDLFIVNRNGLNMRWLTRMEGIESQPRWSPDGTKILFRGSSMTRTDLYTINVDGTGLVNLTTALPASITQTRDPAWSPGGDRIAFIGVQGTTHKVWTMKSDGTDARQVTTDAGFDMQPAFSPDGSEIAFVRYDAQTPANGDDILIVSAQGGAPRRLALPGDQRQPAWSADGQYIAVSGTTVAGRGVQEIFTLRPDGSGLRPRTVSSAWGGGVGPAWIARP
ncbi:MAG TPA: Ig-like domain-containing protein [Gemmatimonadaceae bacterium]|nr:Ig-like domain-containing protein [Gemmatimonadaceae bacterium]